METALLVPYLKDVSLQLGPWFMLLTYFVIVGSGNAVNLTDGLDGLAIMPTVLVAGALAVFVYAAGHSEIAGYLRIPHIYPEVGELVVFCGALVGAGLGFLWFNAYPAQVFMGDVGALALGAALGVVAVCVRTVEADAVRHGRCVRDGDRVGDSPGGLLQAHRATHHPAWRRCIITSNSSAGRAAGDRAPSGSSPWSWSWLVWPA